MSVSSPTNGTPTQAASTTVVGPGSCLDVSRETSAAAYQSAGDVWKPGSSSRNPSACAASASELAHDRLSSRGVVARAFPALCADGQRYSENPLFGAERSAMSALAGSVLALPFHGRVQPDDMERFADAIA